MPFSWLWVLSLGEPKAVLEGWMLLPSRRWSQGVYRSREEVAVGAVVLRELQPEAETLAPRLFGDGAMRPGLTQACRAAWRGCRVRG